MASKALPRSRDLVSPVYSTASTRSITHFDFITTVEWLDVPALDSCCQADDI